MIKTRSFQYQDREYRIQAQIISCGEDLCVMISGGDRPHIGAAALSVWTESASNSQKHTATPSVIAVPGHKEYQLALEAAERLSRDLERTVIVTAGIHIDGITADLIEKIVEEFQALVADLSETMLKN